MKIIDKMLDVTRHCVRMYLLKGQTENDRMTTLNNSDYLMRTMWACGVFSEAANGNVDRMNDFVASFVCPSIRHTNPELTFGCGDPANEPGSIMHLFNRLPPSQ